MNRNAICAVVFAVVIGGLGGSATAADDPCGCWLSGYEDGLEFTWDNRSAAENYQGCAKKGGVQAYEDGFKAAQEHKARKCPLRGGTK